MEVLRRTPQTPHDLECPHGVQFFDVVEDGERGDRLAWSYEAQQEAMRRAGHWIGFWRDVSVEPCSRSDPVHVDLQRGVGGAHLRLGVTELPPDHVRPLDERGRLVRGDGAWNALAAEAARGRDDELLRPDRLDARADRGGDLLDRFDLHGAVADDAE